MFATCKIFLCRSLKPDVSGIQRDLEIQKKRMRMTSRVKFGGLILSSEVKLSKKNLEIFQWKRLRERGRERGIEREREREREIRHYKVVC